MEYLIHFKSSWKLCANLNVLRRYGIKRERVCFWALHTLFVAAAAAADDDNDDDDDVDGFM